MLELPTIAMVSSIMVDLAWMKGAKRSKMRTPEMRSWA